MRTSFLFTTAFAIAAIATPLERRSEEDSTEDAYSVQPVAGEPLIPPFPSPILRHDVDKDAVDEDVADAEDAEDLDKRADAEDDGNDYDSTTTVTTTSTLKSTIFSTVTVTSSGSCTTTSTSGLSSSSTTAKPTTKKPVTTTSKKTTSKRTTSSKAAATTPAKSYKQIILDHHNIHRRNHSAPDLIWSTELETSARIWAEKCYWAHNTSINGGNYGQNIAAGVSKANVATVVSDLWYDNEVNYFNGQYGKAQPNMDNFHEWGHFTQVVWKQTSKVGCYTAPCSKGMSNLGAYYTSFTVCNYKGPGNFLGEFNNGVGRPLKHPSVYGRTSFNLNAYKSY